MYDRAWATVLLWLTPSCLMTGMFAASHGQHDTALGEIAVFASSMMHWRSPKPGWSRWRVVDMITVQTSLAVHLRAMWAAGAVAACVVMTVALACFGWSLQRNSYAHHAAGWLAACASNVLLTYARAS